MHIMEVVSGVGFNGCIHHAMLLIRELAARGHQVSVVCLPDSRLAKQLADDPVTLVPSDLHRFPFDELRRVARIARQTGVEVVHTHMSRAHFFGVLLRLFSGIPSVATAHSRHFQLHWAFNDLVIAVSDAVRRYHRRYNLVRSSRITTIHNFIDNGRILDLPASIRAEIRGELGIGESTCLLGTVGMIYPKKGHRYLIEALRKIVAVEPDTRLIIVGHPRYPRYERQVRAVADKLGMSDYILWTGRSSRVPEMLHAMDIYVHPSLEEALGMSILEAMAAGLPVVGSRVGGIPECLWDGQTGTLVPPAQGDALADAILALIRDPELRHRYGATGKAVLLEHFSAPNIVPQIEAALAATARRSPAQHVSDCRAA